MSGPRLRSLVGEGLSGCEGNGYCHNRHGCEYLSLFTVFNA